MRLACYVVSNCAAHNRNGNRFCGGRVVQRLARLLHAPVKAILTPYPEVGTDIDRLEHWLAVQRD